MLPQKSIVTVSQVTKEIKFLLETAFAHVRVEGEVSNLRIPSSGHCYFSLKDATTSIRCVMFRHQAQQQIFRLTDGIHVVVTARVSVYERDGQYQLYVEHIDPQGKGALQLAFEQLKARLLKEGLFDEGCKKPLPFLPQAIGVVTSATGAVIRDIIHVLEQRYHNFHLLLYPVKVQGDGAKTDIVEALHYFNREKCVEVIILARGGGSIEDLWAFNEEIVARAIADSDIPVVSAVGHETDFTIADFVSDVRAPTPSRAAEIVIPQKRELEMVLARFEEDVARALHDYIPERRQAIDELEQDLHHGMESHVERVRNRVAIVLSQLETLSPLHTLQRGYSVTMTEKRDTVCSDSSSLHVGDRIYTRLHKGGLVSCVEEVDGEPKL